MFYSLFFLASCLQEIIVEFRNFFYSQRVSRQALNKMGRWIVPARWDLPTTQPNRNPGASLGFFFCLLQFGNASVFGGKRSAVILTADKMSNVTNFLSKV
jgi:hypothetical protein